MGRLIYLTPASLDGFIGDGDYSWGAPYAEEIMSVLTTGLADVGTYLYGRRTYETMAVWETEPAVAEQSPQSARFAAMWQEADKVVFSSTSPQVHTRRTRVERELDAQVVTGIKAASRGDLTIGGPTLAAEALRLDLVDVVELLWCPVLLGGGIPVLSAGVRRDLRLRRERRLGSGVVQATYEVIGQVQP
ncbi:MAG: dihydrofolate reductase family protein [Pseudonocardia sp.]|nr:dihydrofolate reductase family protein [Pseudonocardia sp.]